MNFLHVFPTHVYYYIRVRDNARAERLHVWVRARAELELNWKRNLFTWFSLYTEYEIKININVTENEVL